MKKQLLQKPVCSLLVAALVSMIPLAAAQAEDNEQTYRQDSEARGAQGAVRTYQRYEGDSNPVIDPSGVHTYRYDERGAQGPVRSDMSAPQTYQRYEGDSNPIIDPGGVRTYQYAEWGAQGPMRSDMRGTRTYQRYEGDSNPIIDPGGVRTYQDDDRGAQGPTRSDMNSPASEEVNIP